MIRDQNGRHEAVDGEDSGEDRWKETWYATIVSGIMGGEGWKTYCERLDQDV